MKQTSDLPAPSGYSPATQPPGPKSRNSMREGVPVQPAELKVENWALSSSNPGETVLDLFLGSGTTLIACQQQGRRCMGMELDPVHASTILARFEAFTNIKPTLAK